MLREVNHESDKMKKNVGVFVVVLAAVVFAALGVFVLLPTEMTNYADARFAEERLQSDLSVSNQVEFLSGKFQRESIVVFRLLSESFSVDKFSRISAEQPRKDCIERVSELMESCGLDFVPAVDDEFFTFYGADYSVVYVKSKPDSFLIYLGAQ